MNPNITKGNRVRGVIEYLFGRGRHEEHTNQRVVAGYIEPIQLEPPRRDDGYAIPTELVARLEAPLMAAGTLGADKTVWHCSLSVRADERPISDAEWRQMADKFVDRMGFGPRQDKAGCRWVAVHHGKSKAGNDHIHIVVTMATEDGARVYPYGDFPRAQRIAGQLEKEHGLQELSPARDEATTRREVTRGESERARREGKPATDRESVRRTVRAALAASTSEQDWVTRMKAAGLLVSPRPSKGDPGRVSGYSVAAKPTTGKPVWFAGRTLDGDLSIVQARRRWPGAEPADVDSWRRATAAPPHPMESSERIRVWTASADALGAINEGLTRTPPPTDQLNSVARSAADTLAQVAAVAEHERWGPVSLAADALARAGAPPRGQKPMRQGEISNRLQAVAGALAMAGAARTAPEVIALLAVIMQATRLAQRIAELREAQQAAAAAGQARTAAERMLPVLQRAADAGVRLPAGAAADGRTPTVETTLRPQQTTTAAPQRPRADPGPGRTERGPER